jgi:hypothetical protein
MVEFAIVFPVQLLVVLLGIQICLILMGKQVVNYAAFCAARAELVGESAEDAAAIVCIPIGGTATSGGNYNAVYLPGWEGASPDLDILSQRAREKMGGTSGTGVEILEGATANTGRVVVRVRFAYEMMIPLANWVIFYGLDAMNPGLVHFRSLEESGSTPNRALATVIDNVPHLIIQEDGVLAANWPDPAETPHDLVEDPEEYQSP